MKKSFITLIALLLSLAASAAVQYNGLWYNLNTNDNTAEVVASQGAQYSGNIYISNSFYYGKKTYTVTSIGNSAFEGCVDVTSVSIPNSVTSIGNGAFYYCTGLKFVAIPNGVTTIGEGAFSKCSNLKSVVISQSVISISANAFYECKNLVQVISLIQNPSDINEKAFNTYATTTLYVPSGKVSAYGSKKGWKKFANITDGISEDPTKRTIHLAVAGTLSTLISEEEKYQIEELTLTGELNGTDIRLIRDMAGTNSYGTSHGDYVKYYSTEGKLKSLNLSGVNIVSGGGGYITVPWAPPGGGTCTEDCYDDLYTSDNSISHQMFYLTKLESIVIPNSVTSVERDAFYGCDFLTSIKAENNNVYDSREDCNAIIETSSNTLILGLKNTIIPNSVTSIGNNAFSGCSGLTNVTIGNGVMSIGSSAFSGCSGLTSITIPNSVTSIGWSAFGGCTGLTSITIPNSVTTIGSSAFDGTGWYNNQPNGLVYAGNVAYRYKGTMPNNTSITIKDGTVGIAGSAFSGCSGLTSITIPNSVANIGEWAFYSCNELSSLLIPSSVTSIGGSAFYGCEDLVRIVSSSKIPPTCESGTFSSKAYCTVWVPRGCREAYLKANEWKDFKEIKEIDGDINLDGKVNKADIDALVTYIMHGTPAIYGTIADLNNDEKVNTADVVMLVNLLNNGGLSTEFQPYFGNDNGNSIVTSITCTLNNDRKEAIQLTKCELYCNNSLVSYKSYSGGSSSTVAAGGSKDCSFTGLSMPANSSNFSVVWYYTYNGEDFAYRCDLTE